jgi:hypothetical protein
MSRHRDKALDRHLQDVAIEFGGKIQVANGQRQSQVHGKNLLYGFLTSMQPPDKDNGCGKVDGGIL